MMGPMQVAQGALFYEFSIEKSVPGIILCAALIGSSIYLRSDCFWHRRIARMVVLRLTLS